MVSEIFYYEVGYLWGMIMNYGGQITIYVWEKVRRLCELDNSRNYVKCNSTLCVMNNAMQDIQEYFENGKRSSAELCF